MGFKGALINTVLIALFFVALVSIGSNLAINNDVNSTILENTELNKTFNSIDDSLKTFSDDATDRESLLRDDDPQLVSDIGIFGIIKTALTLPIFIKDILQSMLNLIIITLGIPPVVMYSLMAIVMVIIIGVGISLIRRGA